MEKDNRVFLSDILDSIEAIDSYLEGYDFDQFQRDRRTVDAVIRNVEVIGEAANNLTVEFRENNPQIEWRRIIATRNRIIHGYATVDLSIIWTIAQTDLEQLQNEVESLLAKLK